ncbi:MAG: nucleotide exchange factor GrpE [Candidatus Micrarchaeia archaeon]
MVFTEKEKNADTGTEGGTPADPAAKPIEERLAESEKKAGELEERLVRLAAEFDNFKKRSVRENEMLRENAGAEMLLKILPVVDEFEIAIGHIDKASAKEFKHGIELIYSKLQDLLRKEGVEQMRSLGERFDPYKHDALRSGDGEEGRIVEEIVKGYVYRGKVLRHAKVVVGKGK